MWLSDFSVKRPVAAVVLSLLLCVCGILSFNKLAVREYPDIDSPVVSIMTFYAGASANIMESQITQVIEDELSGISGIEEIISVSRNGLSRITVEFDIDWDLTEGVSDVRDATARAQRRLPDAADEPIVSKSNGSGEASIYVNLASSEMERAQLTEYAQRVLEDKFSLITGVSSVDLYGALYKVMYVRLDPVLMAGRGVTTEDIKSALHRENLESPGGEIRNDITKMSVRTERLYQTPEDFNYLVVRTAKDGTPLYLKDVAEVYIGSQNENATYKNNGINNLSLGIMPQSEANPLELAKSVRRLVDEFQPFLPKGTKLWIDYDSTVFIEHSIDEVYSTLYITGGLVVLVLYIFIGQLRATFIPAITVPVSLISAFIAAYFFGFSINLLTLMALILAIGLVVDDAIVVVENIFHHIEKGETPLVAAYLGTREVGFAVVATTVVLVMVFLPISFMEGMVGKLFTEFAVLLSMAVIFSSVVALSLTPVMSSKILKAHVKPNAFNLFVDNAFMKVEKVYRRIVTRAIKARFAAPCVILICLSGSYFLMNKLPAQLVPQEDRGVLMIFVKGAEGTAYNRMVENMEQVERRLLPLVDEGLVASVSLQAPAFGGMAGDQTGFVIIQLKDWNERDETASDVLTRVREELKGLPDIFVRAFMPGFRGGSSDPVQFVLSGPDYKELHQWSQTLLEATKTSPFFQGAELDYAETTPELVVKMDTQRAAEFGIGLDKLSSTMEIMLGGSAQTTFVERGEEFDVYLRGDEARFNNKEDLNQIYMRTEKGGLLSLESLIEVEEVASAQALRHFNKQKSITLNANLSEGHTLGEALTFLDEKAIALFPPDISISYSGESAEFKENQNSILLVFALALLVTYLVLAAQFESFINPLVVMFTVPMGLLGGLFGLWVSGQGLNLYSQIGMIMLIGMVTKNGILIVEFANQLRDRGVRFEEAIIQASVRRLRPIMMTAFTTIIGAIPLILSAGAGHESRVAVGTVIFAGMAFATGVTLVVVPAMYRLLSVKTHSPGFVEAQLHRDFQLNKALKTQKEDEPDLKEGF